MLVLQAPTILDNQKKMNGTTPNEPCIFANFVIFCNWIRRIQQKSS